MASRTSNSLAQTASVSFVPEDFEVLDLALHVSPALRAVAYALKLARAMSVQYPIASLDDMVAYMPSASMEVASNAVTSDSVRMIFPQEFFPIEDEFDLLRKMHITFMRCRNEARRAISIGPAVYEGVMREVQHPGK